MVFYVFLRPNEEFRSSILYFVREKGTSPRLSCSSNQKGRGDDCLGAICRKEVTRRCSVHKAESTPNGQQLPPPPLPVAHIVATLRLHTRTEVFHPLLSPPLVAKKSKFQGPNELRQTHSKSLKSRSGGPCVVIFVVSPRLVPLYRRWHHHQYRRLSDPSPPHLPSSTTFPSNSATRGGDGGGGDASDDSAAEMESALRLQHIPSPLARPCTALLPMPLYCQLILFFLPIAQTSVPQCTRAMG